MTLKELVAHYDNPSLPKPAYATLCALRRFEPIEQCFYAVVFKGVTVAAFRKKERAEGFAALGRRDTLEGEQIKVVDLRDEIPEAVGS